MATAPRPIFGRSRNTINKPVIVYRYRDQFVVFLLCAILALIVTACATSSMSINSQQGIAYEAVTFARQSSTTLLRAGKISLKQDQDTQTKLSAVDAAVAAATSIEAVTQAKAQADAIAKSNGAQPK